VDIEVFVAMMMGALPALFLMFYIMRPFEGVFNEQSTLYSFVIGMVVGVVAGVLHVLLDRTVIGYFPTAMAFFVFGFAAFDQMMRVAVFNNPRFSGRTDTTFYATAFGLGYGSMLAALWFFRTFVNPDVTINAWVVASYFAAAFAFAVVHGTTGMLVGFGATEKEVWRFGILGIGIEAVLNFLWYLALASGLYAVTPIWELGVIAMAVAAVYGIYLLRWTMNKVSPDLLPLDQMRKSRRFIRKRKRTTAK
jgi:hypothetical protein